MLKKVTLLLSLLFIFNLSHAQWDMYQYFDGTDSVPGMVLQVHLVPDSQNIWQIGPPQKVIFDSAATWPNAIVTDTLNLYPAGNTSSFDLVIDPFMLWGILAVQWKQKLDMKPDSVGGILQFSPDNGLTWQNAFNNPYVYNFYGFDSLNVDTLTNGEIGFTGTDSTWRDIWLCYDMTWGGFTDSLRIRYTFQSDSILIDSMNPSGEGWMIDNMMTHLTIIHTAKEPDQMDYLTVYPTATTGVVNISARKVDGYHAIEHMELSDMQGRVVRTYGHSPTKFWIDIGDLRPGKYFLRITTNLKTETFPVILQR